MPFLPHDLTLSDFVRTTGWRLGLLLAAALLLVGCASAEKKDEDSGCTIPAYTFQSVSGAAATVDADGCITVTDHVHIMFDAPHTADTVTMTVKGTFNGSYASPLFYNASATNISGRVVEFYRNVSTLTLNTRITEIGANQYTTPLANSYNLNDEFEITVTVNRTPSPDTISGQVMNVTNDTSESFTASGLSGDVSGSENVMGVSVVYATIEEVEIE
jgi:hypothetical protein